MTTHQTVPDLTDHIVALGNTRIDDDQLTPVYQSSVAVTVGKTLALLHSFRFRLVDSQMLAPDIFSMTLSSPDERFPDFIDVRYLNPWSRAPFLAICYHGEDGRLIQFVKPYRTFVTVPGNQDSDLLLEKFHEEHGADTPPVLVPILAPSLYVHF